MNSAESHVILWPWWGPLDSRVGRLGDLFAGHARATSCKHAHAYGGVGMPPGNPHPTLAPGNEREST